MAWPVATELGRGTPNLTKATLTCVALQGTSLVRHYRFVEGMRGSWVVRLVMKFEKGSKYESNPTAFILKKEKKAVFFYVFVLHTCIGKAGGDVEMKVAGTSAHPNGRDSVCRAPMFV